MAKLKILVKSHKEEGDVSFRVVHARPCFSYEAHSERLMRMLREALVGHRNLVLNSLCVAKELANLQVPQPCTLVKVDIRDFYVVGESHKIAQQLSSLFQDKMLSRLVFDVAFFLLSRQYVKHGRSLRRVKEGCGIGLLHAGDMADACYYAMVEKTLIACEEHIACGIIRWFRFRDDMLFVCSSNKGFSKLKAKMEVLSDWFELKVEDFSQVKIRFLDLSIRCDQGRLEVEPFLKDPRLSRRLSRLSAHHISIHKAWPVAIMNRIQEISSGKEAACLYMDE